VRFHSRHVLQRISPSPGGLQASKCYGPDESTHGLDAWEHRGDPLFRTVQSVRLQVRTGRTTTHGPCFLGCWDGLCSSEGEDQTDYRGYSPSAWTSCTSQVEIIQLQTDSLRFMRHRLCRPRQSPSIPYHSRPSSTVPGRPALKPPRMDYREQSRPLPSRPGLLAVPPDGRFGTLGRPLRCNIHPYRGYHPRLTVS